MTLLSRWSLWSMLNAFLMAFIIGKWVYWTYYQDGAAKLARHPGLINLDWIARFLPASIAFGLVVSTVGALLDAM